MGLKLHSLVLGGNYFPKFNFHTRALRHYRCSVGTLLKKKNTRFIEFRDYIEGITWLADQGTIGVHTVHFDFKTCKKGNCVAKRISYLSNIIIKKTSIRHCISIRSQKFLKQVSVLHLSPYCTRSIQLLNGHSVWTSHFKVI